MWQQLLPENVRECARPQPDSTQSVLSRGRMVPLAQQNSPRDFIGQSVRL